MVPFQYPPHKGTSNPGYSAPAHQMVPYQESPSNDLANHIKVNDANMRAMQNQISNLKNEFDSSITKNNKELRNDIKDMFAGLVKQLNPPSTSGTLPGNTVPNPKGELKAITTHSGKAHDGPSISIPSPVKERERETKVTKDPVLSSNNGSTHYVQTTVVQNSTPPITPTSTRVDPTLE